jgi:hypothetical protein
MNNYKPESDLGNLRESLSQGFEAQNKKVEGIKVPFSDEQSDTEATITEIVNEPIESKVKVRKKTSTFKYPMSIDKKRKVTFNGEIHQGLKHDSEVQTVGATHFYFKQESLLIKNMAAENEISLLELLHVLIANAIENGMPEEMLQRYLDAKEASKN